MVIATAEEINNISGEKAMTGKTHIMGGIAATTAYAYYSNYDPTALIISGAIGSIIPDICHGGSKIGRRFPILSNIINAIFGHRTITHSLIFLVLIGYILTLITDNQSIIMGVVIGMASHLILDACTKNGIKLLYPASVTIRLPITTRTGGTVENIVLIALTIVTICFGKEFIL